jgi:hypothetical protein
LFLVLKNSLNSCSVVLFIDNFTQTTFLVGWSSHNKNLLN